MQLCYVNDTVNEPETPSSDSESCPKLSKPPTRYNSMQANPYSSRPLSVKKSQINDKSEYRNGRSCSITSRLTIELHFIFRSTKKLKLERIANGRRSERDRFLHETSASTDRSTNGIGTSQRYGTHADGGEFK